MAEAPRIPVQSWGRIGAPLHEVVQPTTIPAAERLVQDGRPWLASGMLRSYGDVARNAGGRLIDCRGLDRFISFDPRTGILEAEGGVTLQDVLRITIPKGWFLATTPGTRHVTLGGAVANDVHGRNHHRVGTFGRWVRGFDLLRSDGLVHCTPQDNSGLFEATIGGLGLTGLIVRVTLQLTPIPSAYLETETIPFRDLDAYFALEEQSTEWEHSAAWMDVVGGSAGRGIFTRSNWAKDKPLDPGMGDPILAVPFEAPNWALNSLSIKAFNEAYYRLGVATAGRKIEHFAPSLHILDGVREWNKLYGSRGFYQYQCVVPKAVHRQAMKDLLQEIARSGEGSFLVVIKVFGDLASPGLMSFPMPGANLALDFPNRGADTLALLARLDRIVAEAGGRIYAAKDARMPGAMFRQGYPAWEKVAALKDPCVHSDFWDRVMA